MAACRPARSVIQVHLAGPPAMPMTVQPKAFAICPAIDPVTPAAYAQQILPGLSRAKHLILRGQGHGQIAIGCVPRLAAEFISAASSEALDTSCIESVKPAAFMLSRVATAP